MNERNGYIKDPSGLVLRKSQPERARPVRWPWDRRILFGYITLFIGEEEVGKSTLFAWIAAQVTRGELPGSAYKEPSLVLFVGDEDSWNDIWGPRLHVVGADRDLVLQLSVGTRDDAFDITRHCRLLDEYLKGRSNVVIFFDQLLDNIGYTDSWKDKQVRDALAPLRRLARRRGCAVVCTLHPNKRGGSYRDRISGTPAFSAVSKSGIFIARHPMSPDRRVAVVAKRNYAATPEAFEFDIEPVEYKTRSGLLIKTARVCNTAYTNMRAADLFKQPETIRERRVEAAKVSLAGMFRNGEVVESTTILEQMKEEGFTRQVTHEAREALGIKTEKQKGVENGPWLWSKPATKQRR